MLLFTTFTFESSHSLITTIGQPQTHGHSYWARVYVRSSSREIVPLPRLEAHASEVKVLLDHQHLNDLMDENPTMEALVGYIRRHWRGPALERVLVWRESLGCGVEWNRADYD